MLVSSLRRAPLLIVLLALAACGAPKAALNGRVIDAYTQQPVKDASLVFGERKPVAAADGLFSTQAWSPKDTLAVTAPGYEAATLNLAERPELAAAEPTTKTLDMVLRPNTLRGAIKDSFTGAPVANALVATDTVSATTAADGTYTLANVPESFALQVTAPDYAAGSAQVSRSTAQDLELRPSVLRGSVKDAYSQQGVAGVEVTAGTATATTGADGSFELADVPADGDISFKVSGYDQVVQPLPRDTALDVTLRPSTVTGVVTGADGQPLAEATVLASATVTGTEVAMTRTDAQGRYTLENVPANAFVKALLPGYRRGETALGDRAATADLQLEPIEAKALYIKTSVAASGMETIDEYFDLIDRTELNAAVIDLKSDNIDDVGLIYYQSQVPEVIEADTSRDYMPIEEILAEAKRRNIYTIARIHIFAHDNALLEKHPDWYIQKDGKPWFADFGIAWLDTYDERVWDYNIKLGVEAAQMGFDEVQFDYIRFPSDGDLTGTVMKGPRDSKNNPDEMFNTIGRFMERAQAAINGAGAYFGVDVFGYVAWAPQRSIGQNLQIMGQHADYVYPMVYPSHFVPGELGFDVPGRHPFEMVDRSMGAVKAQLTGAASRAKVRPWLQDFTLIWVEPIVRYGAAEVRAQIDAAEAHRADGVAGWALWDSDNDYEEGALKAK